MYESIISSMLTLVPRLHHYSDEELITTQTRCTSKIITLKMCIYIFNVCENVNILTLQSSEVMNTSLIEAYI